MFQTLRTLAPDLAQEPLTKALILHFSRLRNKRKWRWSTMLKNLASCQGALHLLPLYLEAPQLDIKHCPVWQQAMRGASIEAKQQLPKQPVAAQWHEVRAALLATTSEAVFCAILLAWMSCARCGCILKLSKEDLQMHADGTLSLRFRRGKSVRARGPYTVHTTTVPPDMRERLKAFVETRSSWLFPKSCTGAMIKTALRTINPVLEQRSLRRGSLQLLASSFRRNLFFIFPSVLQH